ncbi:unnamed protein product [Porites evermanni]|uniref:Uncharacterized protein n=1 Tax=Porites evermanni TaxID=104178 RepID=A0ABN8MP75_9CNID|nr:unnamed protein product [Porites evermanni]
MAVVFGLNPVQSGLHIRMLVTPDMAVTLLNLGPRWPQKLFSALLFGRIFGLRFPRGLYIRDGAWTVVASSGKATCPVAMVNRYLERAGLSCDSPLFCQLSKTKCGYKPRSKEAFKDIVRDIYFCHWYA